LRRSARAGVTRSWVGSRSRTALRATPPDHGVFGRERGARLTTSGTLERELFGPKPEKPAEPRPTPASSKTVAGSEAPSAFHRRVFAEPAFAHAANPPPVSRFYHLDPASDASSLGSQRSPVRPPLPWIHHPCATSHAPLADFCNQTDPQARAAESEATPVGRARPKPRTSKHGFERLATRRSRGPPGQGPARPGYPV
jgi:hypothetical protein